MQTDDLSRISCVFLYPIDQKEEQNLFDVAIDDTTLLPSLEPTVSRAHPIFHLVQKVRSKANQMHPHPCGTVLPGLHINFHPVPSSL